MEKTKQRSCSNVLKALMAHPSGWIFNQPVDPVALKIPDYFDIIKKPMDLGTIKSKLEKNLYLCPKEFAADVRLTFTNAMNYNPPMNPVHQMAKELDNLFSRRWKLLEAKAKREKTPDDGWIVSRKKSMMLEDKQSLKRELLGIMRSKMTENLRAVLRKFGLLGLNEERIDLDIDTWDDETLWDLKRTVEVYFSAISAKGHDAATKQSERMPLSGKIVHKGAESTTRNAFRAASDRVSVSSENSKCHLCSNMTCHCRLSHTQHKPNAPRKTTADASRTSNDKKVMSSGNSRYALEKPVMKQNGGSSLSVTVVRRGNNHMGDTSGAACKRKLLSSDNSGCSLCGFLTCQCSRKQTCHASKDTSAEQTAEKDYYQATRISCERKNPVASDARRRTLDSSGTRSVLNEEHLCFSSSGSNSSITSVPDEGSVPIFDAQLSPKRALRVAMLKSRFADTIFKAKEKTLLDNGDKVDTVKMQQQRARLEKQQREEKARIQAQIEATEAASRLQEEELQMRRHKAREAARMALEKMEKTVEIDDNNEILEDLETLSQCSLLLFCERESCHLISPLSQLGLSIKEEYMLTDDDLDDHDPISMEDAEEGEILS